MTNYEVIYEEYESEKDENRKAFLKTVIENMSINFAQSFDFC